MGVIGMIPARYASTRFPGKPLAEIAGVPMIRRVYERARRASSLRDVYVATDDARIADACANFGAEVLLTGTTHATGTDRLAEAARAIDADVIVNIQGDEPLIEGFVIDAAVRALLAEPTTPMSTVVHAMDEGAAADRNRVKAVLDDNGFATSFSRDAVSTGAGRSCWQHVGVYAYRRSFLLEFVGLPRTPGERAEELEQLRALEHGFRIRCAVVDGWRSVPVDVPADIAKVEAMLAARSAN